MQAKAFRRRPALRRGADLVPPPPARLQQGERHAARRLGRRNERSSARSPASVGPRAAFTRLAVGGGARPVSSRPHVGGTRTVFIEEHLRELGERRYTPHAWWVYARRVGAHLRARRSAREPGAGALDLDRGARLLRGGVRRGRRHVARLGPRSRVPTSSGGTALWMGVAFTMVTLFVSLLRDENGYRLSSLNVPILLTLLRFVDSGHLPVPARAPLHDGARHVRARGAVRRARRLGRAALGQITRLGTIMDPMVDVVFNLAILSGTHRGRTAALGVLGRRGALRHPVVGGAGLYLFVGPVRIRRRRRSGARPAS